MTVLTAIPYYGVSEELINKAVRCALAQTYRDHVVLVVGDGQIPPVWVRDDRLVVVTSDRNRGAPFTQQAMILASPFEWYAPHGADDWTEPGYLAALMAMPGPAKGEHRIKYTSPGATASFIAKSKNWAEFGLFSTRLLMAVGGYAAQEPCGQDSLLLSILDHVVGISYLEEPLYHKVGRPDSLTGSPKTGFGSPLRQGVRDRNQKVLAQLARIGWSNIGAIRAYRERLVPLKLRGELYDLSYKIEKAIAAPKLVPAMPPVKRWDDGPPPRRVFHPREVKW